ncbi:hypothetical protein M434DRAFT_395173 [Hypoxylon sp. CO27-5]|nr:hypothetical protein M434DRAFT_395173 [Hypoxylon sp. CO27-5]
MARISCLNLVALSSLGAHVTRSLNFPEGPYRVPIPVKNDLTTVSTNITSDRQPVSVDIDVKRATLLLQTALDAEATTYDGDIGDAATRLVRYDGCDNHDVNEIYKGWVQSWKIMNQVLSEVDNINWNEASAVDYLGPPGVNGGIQDRIRDLYKRWATIQPRYITTSFDWRLHVRCDDPKKKCGEICSKDPKLRGPWAYTTNKDDESGLARINFCPRYFGALNLKNAIDFGKNPVINPTWQYDVSRYMMNKAHVWAHELMHIKWATNAKPYGPNDYVADVRMWTKIVGVGEGVVKAYGPQPVKALARYGEDGGTWVLRNADSLALYASVRYIQNQLGNVYPYLPVAPAAPSNAWDPNNTESDSVGTLSPDDASRTGWKLYNNGTIRLPPVDTFGSLAREPHCPAAFPSGTKIMPPDDFFDEDAGLDPAYEINFDTFVTADKLDRDYVDQLNGWYNDLYKTNRASSRLVASTRTLKDVLLSVREKLNWVKSRRITW